MKFLDYDATLRHSTIFKLDKKFDSALYPSFFALF